MRYASDPKASERSGSRRARRTIAARIVRTIYASVFLAFAAIGLGFGLFVDAIYSDDNSKLVRADGIAVFTGGYARLEPAANLLKQGFGKRLLVTGVNVDTGVDAVASALGANQEMVECCVDIDRDALNTIGNAREVSEWMQTNNYRSVIIVTNNYHVPRSVNELKRIAPNVDIQSYSVINPPKPDEDHHRKIDRYRVLLLEYVKYLASFIR
ncbi:MAG: YdcF family protein [Pseudomonadota bacterium]